MAHMRAVDRLRAEDQRNGQTWRPPYGYPEGEFLKDQRRDAWEPPPDNPGEHSRSDFPDAEKQSECQASNATVVPWPEPPAVEAFHGLAGDIVRAIAPYTEADPVALLLQGLTAFGNMIGRTAYFRVEGDLHHSNL